MVLAVWFPTDALAHAAYDRSDPPANAIVPVAPSEVHIWFVEPLEPARSGAALYDQTGTRIEGVTSAVDPADGYSLVVRLPSGLANGTYSLAWYNVSAADGHGLEGYFAFTIGTAADVGQAAVVETGGGGPPAWLRSLSRWAALVGLAAAVAIWPIWLFVLTPAFAGSPDAGAQAAIRAQWLAIAALLLALAGDVFALVVQAAAGGDQRFGDAVWTTLADTRYGRLWLLRVALLAAYATAISWARWWPASMRQPAGLIALGLALALPYPFSLISHAAAQTDGRTTAIAVDLVHLLGASIWIGGLYALAGVLLPMVRDVPPGERRPLLAKAVPRFSAIALAAWAATGLTGLYTAWLQVGSLEALTDTSYGKSLIAKLALLLPLLGLGALNLLVVRSRVRDAIEVLTVTRWASRFAVVVVAEVVLVTILLLVVGRLTSQEPAREELASREPAGITLPLDLATSGEARPSTLSISPGTPGPNEYRLEVGGSPLPDGTEAVVRLEMTSVGLGQKELVLTSTGENAFAGSGSELAISGDWVAEVIVRKLGVLETRTTTAIPVTATPATTATRTTSAWRFEWPGAVGLVFVVIGLAGLVAAWALGASTTRFRAGLGGASAIFVGAILLVGARIPPAEATLGGLPSGATASAGFATPVSDDGLTVTLEPGPVAFGLNALAVHVADTGGAPVADATVTVASHMPGMFMGDSAVTATPAESGRYLASDVPLEMFGEWQIIVTVERADQDPATFGFVVAVD